MLYSLSRKIIKRSHFNICISVLLPSKALDVLNENISVPEAVFCRCGDFSACVYIEREKVPYF